MAGQRVQVIKPVRGRAGIPGGSLQFGTEVIASADGSIAGLLGASPGASTAVPVMLEVMQRCFGDRFEEWRPALEKMMPSHGVALAGDPVLAADVMERTSQVLGLEAPATPAR